MQLYILTFVCLLAGQVCSEQACKDGLPEVACQSLQATGKCELSEVKNLCPLTCGVCATPPGSTPIPTPNVTVPAWCVNQLPDADCDGLKSTGKCLLSVVKGLCPIQCHACEDFKPTHPTIPPKECKNQGPKILCDVLQSTGRCVFKDIQTLCPVDCNACDADNATTSATDIPLPTLGPNDECKDQLPSFLCVDLKMQNKCDSCVIQALCPEQCDTCGGVNYTCLPATTTPAPTTTTPKLCVDKSVLCTQFLQQCGKDPIVTSLCEKSCGLCGPTPAASTTTTTPAATTTTTPAMPPLKCHQCGSRDGTPCNAVELIMGPAKPCPAEKPYCMTDINIVGGQKHIVKRCASLDSCKNDWFQATSDKDYCTSYDSSDTSIQNLNGCHFCCTKDGCNKLEKPDVDDLYDP